MDRNRDRNRDNAAQRGKGRVGKGGEKKVRGVDMSCLSVCPSVANK
jgi:hypothetical protein